MQVLTSPTSTLSRILPLGDSLVVGYQNVGGAPLWNGGWRLPLQNMMLAAGKKFEFMGAQFLNSTNMQWPYHEGVGSQRIDQILARAMLLPDSPAPDVILLGAGINAFYYYTVDPVTYPIASVQSDYTAMLDALFAKWPSCKICCDTIGQFFGTFAAMQALTELTDFNNYIIALPGSHPNGANIKAVQFHTLITNTNLTGDGLHPIGWTYQLMAYRWWAALKTLI